MLTLRSLCARVANRLRRTAPTQSETAGTSGERDSRRNRLESAIRAVEASISQRKACAPLLAGQLEPHLTNARKAFEESKFNAGWIHLHEAERVEIFFMEKMERAARVTTLREEAKEKLSGWRKSAVLELLRGDDNSLELDEAAVQKPPCTPELGGSQRSASTNGLGLGEVPIGDTDRALDSERKRHDRTPTKERVQEAVRLLNGHFDNQYTKIDAMAEALRGAAMILCLIIGVLIAVLAWVPPAFAETGLNWNDIPAVLGFGALGGALSVITSVSGSRGQRIPEQLATFFVSAARTVFGAGVAVAVYVLLKSGWITLAGDKTSIVPLAAAFLAGFSERWFLGLVKMTEKS
jgi:hypothetical protein